VLDDYYPDNKRVHCVSGCPPAAAVIALTAANNAAVLSKDWLVYEPPWNGAGGQGCGLVRAIGLSKLAQGQAKPIAAWIRRKLLIYWRCLHLGLYLQDEIQAEGLTRAIGNFSRFLDVAGACNAEQVNFSKVGKDAQISPRTVHDYFKILEDTLIGTLVPPFLDTSKRKAVTTAKFFWFDLGVANVLTGRTNLHQGTAEYGKALEHLIFCELRAYIAYHRVETKLSYWRTQTQLEVDFVLTPSSGATVAIEVKASRALVAKDFRGLNAFAEEVPGVRKIMVALVPSQREASDGTEIWPVADFLTMLWRGRIL